MLVTKIEYRANAEKWTVDLRRRLPQAVLVGVQAAIFDLVSYTVDTKFENRNPPYLNRQTGTAIRSITASPRFEVSRRAVTGSYGSNLGYVVRHEFGGVETVTVPAHERGPFTRTTKGGKTVTVRRHMVKAHQRTRQVAARHMFRDAWAERSGRSALMVRRAVAILGATGRVPQIGELGAGVMQTIRSAGGGARP